MLPKQRLSRNNMSQLTVSLPPAIFLAFYIKRKPFIKLCEVSAVFGELFSVSMTSAGGVCSIQWIVLRVFGGFNYCSVWSSPVINSCCAPANGPVRIWHIVTSFPCFQTDVWFSGIFCDNFRLTLRVGLSWIFSVESNWLTCTKSFYRFADSSAPFDVIVTDSAIIFFPCLFYNNVFFF